MTSEQQPFDWEQFHEVAARLLEHGDEASFRCAVSRDYYAIFHRAKIVLAKLDPTFINPRGHGSHEVVWERLESMKRKEAKQLATLGRGLLRQRKRADYEHPISKWPELAKQAHEEAKRGLRHAAALLMPAE